MNIPFEKMQGIWLDVSGRQTLKTARLVKAVISHLATHSFNRAFIVCMNHNMCHEMRNRFGTRSIDTHLAKVIHQSQYQHHIDQTTDFERERFFFDEFDAFAEQCAIVEHGYYCTSPSFLRTQHDPSLENGEDWNDDTLMILSRIAYGIVRIRNTSKLKQNEVFMMPEQIKTEILGQFVHA